MLRPGSPGLISERVGRREERREAQVVYHLLGSWPFTCIISSNQEKANQLRPTSEGIDS